MLSFAPAVALALGLAVGPTPVGKLAAIQARVAAAEKAYAAAAEKLPDTPEGQKAADALFKAFDAAQQEAFAAAVKLAEADPESEVAWKAVEWLLLTPRSYYTPVGGPAFALAAKYHADRPGIDRVVLRAARHGPHVGMPEYARLAALIDAVAERNPRSEAKGAVHYARAQTAMQRFSVAEYKKKPAAEVDALAAKAEAAYELVARESADVPFRAKRTLGEEAATCLYELRHLRVGKVAPDLIGESLDGKPLKLSDFRGKVTVVIFWATWCGPCMQEVPHERELMARYAGRPFTILGVNGDPKREVGLVTTVKEKMTWPHLWVGPAGDDSPICRAWNVQGWPTEYVLDTQGVIRAKGVRMADLDRAVAELLPPAR